MHARIIKNLKKKGWDQHLLDKTVDLWHKGKEKRPSHVKKLDENIHLFLTFFILIGNMIIVYGLLPFVLFSPYWFGIIIMASIGLVIGFILDNFLTDLQTHHYNYILLVSLLLTAGIIFWRYLEIEKILAAKGIFIKSNPLVFISVFIISFALPHIVIKLKNHAK